MSERAHVNPLERAEAIIGAREKFAQAKAKAAELKVNAFG